MSFQPSISSEKHPSPELIAESRILVKKPTKAQRCFMEKELFKPPKEVKKDIDEVRNWISSQPHLPKVTNDTLIENFLLGCKYDVEKTKTMMDRYFCVRAQKPIFFENRDPSASDIAQSFEVMYSVPMPELTPEGYRVVVLGLLDDDASKFSLLGLLRRNLMVVDLGLAHDKSIEVVEVTDCSKMSLRHLRKLSVSCMKDYLYCCLNAAPLRIKGIHLVNLPPFYGKLVTFIKLCLPQKLKERVYTHGTVDSLFRYIPKHLLPVELSGEGPSVRDLNERWHRFLIAHQEWFLTEGSKKADLQLKKQETRIPAYWLKIQRFFSDKKRK